MHEVTAYAAFGPGEQLRPYRFERRDLRPHDVAVRVRYCGVCHTDLHAVEAPPPGHLPLVPGHEFVGEVTAVGSEVAGLEVGDDVAVGNIVDSCGVCPPCRAGREVYCERQRAAVAERMAELAHDAVLIDDKIAQYRRLIAHGLDCEDEGAATAVGA